LSVAAAYIIHRRKQRRRENDEMEGSGGPQGPRRLTGVDDSGVPA
jgi:hypothetical protein